MPLLVSSQRSRISGGTLDTMDAIVDISHVTFDIKQGRDYGRERIKEKGGEAENDTD